VLNYPVDLRVLPHIASAHGGAAQAAPVSPHGLRVTVTLAVQPDSASRPSYALRQPSSPKATPNAAVRRPSAISSEQWLNGR
jgi:hypothetical protein